MVHYLIDEIPGHVSIAKFKKALELNDVAAPLDQTGKLEAEAYKQDQLRRLANTNVAPPSCVALILFITK